MEISVFWASPHRWLCISAFLLAISNVSHAELGGNTHTIDSDSVGMKAQKKALVSGFPSYTVHQMELPSQTIVRQYASPAGIVFAVTWQGPFKPDLRELLGRNFEKMIAYQSRSARRGHTQLTINEADLVVESGGRMRNFFGRAYLPAEIPPGLAMQEIK
jgi:hypothetical protein